MTYAFLHEYLRQQGFILYPHEIICGNDECEHERNRLVDVAARKDGLFYAFEYKSSADRLLRAVKQVDNYRKSFDYVIVVAEVPRTDISVDPKRGVRIKEILKLGAGLWTVQFTRRRNIWQKAELAKMMAKISEEAPIQAHEIETESKGKLKTQRDVWFWFFYSVMDRRSDAATFIQAKKILEEAKLYTPSQILRAIQEEGKEKIVGKITSTLTKAGFRLLKDRTMGLLSQPRSIVEAAQFIAKFDLSFNRLYEQYRDKVISLWTDLQNIYGVGPRIASQFIRGMVLKGSWNLPLDDNRFLEECDFNIEMASKLGLISDKTRFYQDLGDFADSYLNGNRGIISHVLWFMRKRYCRKSPLCYECPLFGCCFSHDLLWKFTQLVPPQRQNPLPRNREWIELKMLRATSNIISTKRQLPSSQTRLSSFVTESLMMFH